MGLLVLDTKRLAKHDKPWHHLCSFQLILFWPVAVPDGGCNPAASTDTEVDPDPYVGCNPAAGTDTEVDPDPDVGCNPAAAGTDTKVDPHPDVDCDYSGANLFHQLQPLM